jgi:CheY-like chemotaxis protein
MDIQLPEMDGIAAFSELQKFHETCDIPVIALSAQAMKEDINRVMNFGFKDYLTKPINITKFLETLDNILR